MKYKEISLNKFLSNFQISIPNEQIILNFSKELKKLLENINKDNSEEYQKNEIGKFLNKVFEYYCNVKNKIDLAIYEDNQVRVIFESKSVINKSEFVKENSNNLESKAFYESILYFLREIRTGNNNITFIILATAEIFYIINAKDYLNNFSKNKDIIKAFKNCEENGGTDSSTTKFYEEIKNILPKIENEIYYLCVDFKNILNNEFDKLSLLYSLLSPQVLLKRNTYIDANTLNVEFYNELLYILGLKENKENGKIEYSDIKNTFYDSISKTFKLDKDNNFEEIFSLLITWNNRILFLRLLESMLLSFEHIENPFLDLEYLPDFNNLNILFFEVLAKKENERENISKKLEIIPYLNSSLFEKKELEREGKEIQFLQSNNLKIYQHSILKRDKNFNNKYLKNNKSEEIPLLEYLFAFLHAYDFTTTSQDLQNNIKTNYDKLINSAVLGLIFEKFNGYKDGSFYTPSFITNYISATSIQKIVLNKFNEEGYKAKNINELYNAIDDIKEANRIFNEIRICDPAVGSGHFLVSALNELLLIKYNLGLLIDEDGRRLKDIKLELKNDEIVIRDSENNIHNYKHPKHENTDSHKIQRTIFFAKKEIIENNLFGVDINPNSCDITKLRLWIELLKYSYYRDIENKYLETLPNIDINIKCGNSIISRFDLKDSLKNIPKIDKLIKDYKCLVAKYKNADGENSKHSKREIEIKINEIKENLTLNLKAPKTINSLEKEIQAHIDKYGMYLIDDKNLLSGLTYTKNLLEIEELNENEKEKAFESYGRIQILRKKLDSVLSGEEYKNAFEWRLEFPEVLNENGDFIGFDLVIGNPPYGNLLSKSQKDLLKYYKNSDKNEISSIFVELGYNILRENRNLHYIITYAITFSKAQSEIRALLKNNFEEIKIASFDRDGCPIFKTMTQSTSLLECNNKGIEGKIYTSIFYRDNVSFSNIKYAKVDNFLLSKNGLINDYKIEHRLAKIGTKENISIIKKLIKNKIRLKNILGKGKRFFYRSSGNYWYNAFLKEPYKSIEIKPINSTYRDFIFCLINSNIFYWWLRIYGDGRHNNGDIMQNFPIPELDKIKKYNKFLEVLAKYHYKKMLRVFDSKHNRFESSKIKANIDLLDCFLMRFLYKFNIKDIKYICDYDKNIRGGLKINIDKIFKEGKFEDFVKGEKFIAAEIEDLIKKFYFES